MGAINNLTQPQLGEIFRRLKALENAAPMNNGAVGRSGFEVYDGGNINISNGSITINGSLTGAGSFGWTGPLSQSGTSTFTGTTNLNGPTNVAGAFTVTGTTKLNGPTTVGGNTTVTGTLDVTGPMSTKGTLSVEGVTTLKNNLNVTTGGKIIAGTVTIDPSYYSGSVRFTNGTALAATPNGMQMQSAAGVGYATVSDTKSSVGVIGGGEVIATSAGVYMNGIPTTTLAGNVYMDASGRLFRKP